MDTNQRMCSEHISNLVKLSWSLLNTEIKGTASLKGITLSTTMLSLITVPPLKWGNSSLLVAINPNQFNSFALSFQTFSSTGHGSQTNRNWRARPVKMSHCASKYAISRPTNSTIWSSRCNSIKIIKMGQRNSSWRRESPRRDQMS